MEYQTIGERELWGMVREKDVYIVDLREHRDYQYFRINGAHNYPYNEMDTWINTLPKNKRIVVYCEHGTQSMMAARMLARQGYRVYTLIGGIDSLNR